MFSPSVYGDTSTAPLPSRYELPPAVPYLKGKALQLQQDLRDSRRPYIGNVFSYADEPLDTLEQRVSTVTNGVEAGFWPSAQTQMQFTWLPTIFGPKRPHVYGHEYRATIRSQPTTRLRYYTSVGLFHTFHNVKSGLAVLGGAGATYAINDRLRVSGEYRRDIVGDSLLSAVGVNDPVTNQLRGRVKRDRFSVSVNVRPTRKTDMDFRYSTGFDSGHQVRTNPWNEFSFRVGQTLVGREQGAHLQLLQPSYQLLALGFERDLQLTAGYFSPQQFYLNSFRLDAAGRAVGNVYYRVGGSIGTQNLSAIGTKLDDTGCVGTANASLIFRVGRHVQVEQGWYFLQAADTYQRNVIYNQARYYF